ncbi:MAG: AI-2E family transporter [Rhodanobacter sp.]
MTQPFTPPPAGEPAGAPLEMEATVVSEPIEEPEEMPLPQDPKLVFLGGLFIMALLACAYVARSVILPIVLAFLLKLLLQPVMRVFERIRLPRVIASLVVVALVLALLVGVGELLSGPAASWSKRLPHALPRLEQRLRVVSQPVDKLNAIVDHAQKVVSSSGTKPDAPASAPAPASSPSMHSLVLAYVQEFAVGFLTMFLMLFFLLNSGDTFLRRLVEIMPRFRDKRQVIDISWQVESDISGYLITISAMNLLVGIVTGLAMWGLGVHDPLLWGAIAFLLNYVPILGPLTGMVMFLAIGLLSLNPLWKAFMPMVVYVAVHLIEGETFTPMLLARRFTLNPVLVVIALLFWYWMWGVPGAILAVPMLAITKIVCDRVRPLAAFGHFLEGEKRALKP